MITIASAKPTWASAGRVDQVAGGEHAGLPGPHVLVDLDEAPLVDLHPGALEAEVVRQAAGGRPRPPPPRR